MNEPFYAKILYLDSVDSQEGFIEGDPSLQRFTPFPLKIVHVPNSYSHTDEKVAALLENYWWDAVFFLGVRDQTPTFERVLRQKRRNLLGLNISFIPKFVVSAYTVGYLKEHFAEYTDANQRVYHFTEVTFWNTWRSLASSSGLLHYRCPFGYALDPQLDGTVTTFPVEFIRCHAETADLRGPFISVLPSRLFDEVDAIKQFTNLLQAGPNPELTLHEFLDRHPQFLYGFEYERHFSEIYQRWLLEAPGKDQRLDFLLVPRKSLPGVQPKILEIKKDIPAILERKEHAGFVHKVCQAVNQVRDYKRLFQEEAHRQDLQRRTGVNISVPRLAVLIGRFPDRLQIPVFLNRRSELLDVEIVTYDELIMNRKATLSITAPGIERFF